MSAFDLLDEIVPVTGSVTIYLANGDAELLQGLATRAGKGPEQVMLDLLRQAKPRTQARLGDHFLELTCSGCGLPYAANRRPVVGHKNWCPDCRASGEPAADRARRHRDKQRGEEGE